MQPIVDSAFKAIRSLGAPGMFGIFIGSVFATVAALAGFIALCTLLTGTLMPHSGAAVGGFLLSSVIAWLLFPGIMPLVVNFFDVKIARAIEAKDYPQAAPPATDPPFWPEFWHDARFSALAVVLNLLMLPLYFIPPINIFAFYGLNGYLLGREFFVMVARRHLPLAEAVALRKRHGWLTFAGGVLLAFCATVPFVNLIAPFWGIALMVHLYHGLTGNKQPEILLP